MKDAKRLRVRLRILFAFVEKLARQGTLSPAQMARLKRTYDTLKALDKGLAHNEPLAISAATLFDMDLATILGVLVASLSNVGPEVRDLPQHVDVPLEREERGIIGASECVSVPVPKAS
jgi:hypothetical protein